jgi:hypothetical protein
VSVWAGQGWLLLVGCVLLLLLVMYRHLLLLLLLQNRSAAWGAAEPWVAAVKSDTDVTSMTTPQVHTGAVQACTWQTH